MKAIIQFLRTTLVGGLLFLVPIIVLAIVLDKAFSIARRLVDPLSALLPFESVIGLRTPILMAVLLIAFFCFLAGFFARTQLANRIVRGLEESVLSKVPGYALIKSMSGSVLGAEEQRNFPVVLARFDDAWQLGFRIDDLADGLVAVYLPGAPNPHSGAVYFMTADRVEPVSMPFSAAMQCMRHLGAGSNVVLGEMSAQATSPDARA